jgi:exonuclease SbcC
MRILSISGQNIASLADTFVIDFTATPLHGAGLFAITGETGAGKSSILDAMCLALYGDAPRLAGGAASDEVPDPSQKAIKAKDSRTILRRGAAQGWAEVRFTALDGLDYIVTWRARRAGDKVDGNLQSVSRSIARASDGQILAGQTSAVSEQVQLLTGLSYDEFRRTVLLAQGDFDAFLRADTNDRAGLLEKVTGSGQYRAISTRVYERTDAARAAYSSLMLRQGEHQLLSAEARSLLETEQAALTAAYGTGLTERKALTASLDQHRKFDEAVLSLIDAEALERIAAQGVLEAADEHALLVQINRAEPLRLPWQAKIDADLRAAEAFADVQESEQFAQETATAARALQETASNQAAAYDAKEVEFKALGRVWDKAADLDAQIKTADNEAKLATAEALEKAQIATGLQTNLEGLRKTEGETQATKTVAEVALAGLNHALPLADRWEQVSQNLADYADANAAKQKAQDLASGHAKHLETATTRLTVIDKTDGDDRDTEAGLTAELARLDQQIHHLETEHPPQKTEALSALAQTLAALARVQETYAETETALTTAAAAEHDAKTLADNAIVQGADAEAAWRTAEAQIATLVAPVEQADLALSDKASDLRMRLEPDMPCPVCGATDHPIHADDALRALAQSLRQNLNGARAASEIARNQQTAAQGQLAAAQAREKQAKAEIIAAADRQSKALAGWSAGLTTARENLHCPALPTNPADTESTLLAAVASIMARQQAAQTAARDLTNLRKALAEKHIKRETLRATMASRNMERNQLNTEAAELKQAQALAQQQVAVETTRIEKLSISLLPSLAAAQEPLSALDEIATLQARLAALVDRVTQARAALKSANDHLNALGPQIATAASKAENAADQAKHAAGIAVTRQRVLADLRTARAPLLGGEDTATHRTRFNQARKTALDAREAAQTAFGESMQKSARAAANYQTAQLAHAKTIDALKTAEADLAHALTEIALDAETLAALFAVSRDEIEQLRKHLRNLDDAATSARAATASRRHDMKKLQLAGLPEMPAADLAEALETVEASITSGQERIGTISGDLKRDDITRKNLAGLEAETATAKAELDVWQAVNDAIGSRSGNRFARVAQSITLDVLVDRANHHLADLNPRYLLRRAADLALQVEDRDMAGEARATRSLSGGERFLVSLALALALSRMGNQGGLAATLFIDEGFGSLDATSLDLAIDALETLQSQGRQVGVISHVEAMKDRIPTRIAVRKQGGGKSGITISGPDGMSTLPIVD